MKLSIIVPCYNEKDTIIELINTVKTSEWPDKEIIVVDDCSTDGTIQILTNEVEKLVDKVLYHPDNKGKGAALKTGFAHASGDVVIVQDADLEYSPSDYPKLLNPIIQGKADVVYGSRFLGGAEHRVLYFWHSMGNQFLTFLSNMLTDLNLTDMETCYKVIKRDVLNRISIKENRFGFEPEITAKLAKLAKTEGLRIYEVGISYHGRTYEEGKKIGWKDGVRAVICIIKYNLFC